MKPLFAAVAAILIGVVPSAALAEGRGHGGAFPEFHALLKAANLTAEQQTQVHQLMKANWKQARATHEQIQALREQLTDKLAGTGSVTAADLAPLQQQIAQLRAQQDQLRAQTALSVRALLTSEQLRTVAQTHAQIKSLHAQLKALTPEEPERFEAPMRE